jgi:hypothetical protein
MDLIKQVAPTALKNVVEIMILLTGRTYGAEKCCSGLNIHFPSLNITPLGPAKALFLGK